MSIPLWMAWKKELVTCVISISLAPFATIYESGHVQTAIYLNYHILTCQTNLTGRIRLV